MSSNWKGLHWSIYVTLVLAWLGCLPAPALAQHGPGPSRDRDDPGLGRADGDRPRSSWAGDAYEYPVQPGTEAWKELQSHEDMVRVTQVEESLLASMTDEGLVQTVLSYPLLGDVLAYNSPQQGFDAIRSQFGGLRELLEREGAAEVLLRRYQQTDAADVPTVLGLEEQGRRARDLFYLELLLAQREVLAGMDDSRLDVLLLETLVKREQKLERIEVHGLVGLESTAFTAVRALESAQPDPAIPNKVSQKIEAFLETGSPASIEVLDSIFARTEKVVLGSSYRALSKRRGITLKDYASTVYTPKGTAVPARTMTYELTSAQIADCNAWVAANYPNATRLTNCSRRYNCHSYAWYSQSSSNTEWIDTPGDDKYWQDGSYVPASITGGQKVSYASGDHSAIAISGSVYESKWGDFPVMRHAPCYSPYSCSTLNGYQPPSEWEFREGNGGGQSIVCTLQQDQAPMEVGFGGLFSDPYGCDNDEARSVKLSNLPAGAMLVVYDDGGCSTNDDYTRIRVLQNISSLTINSFEAWGDPGPSSGVQFYNSHNNGLDGKVSCIQISLCGDSLCSAGEDYSLCPADCSGGGGGGGYSGWGGGGGGGVHECPDREEDPDCLVY